jgi:FAD:protein FMN transferase
MKLKIAVVVFALVILCGCGPKAQKETRFVLDTFVSMTVPGGKEVKPAIDAAYKRIGEINKKFNVLNPESPFYAFNKYGTPIDDPECVELIKVSLRECEASNGALDITIKPVVELWGFYNNTHRVPAQAELKEALSNVGYGNIAIRNNKIVKLKKGVEIDLGAVGKGYAVGEAVEVLKAAGIKSALIDAGGDIFSIGTNGKKKWSIGIKHPRKDGLLGGLEIDPDITVATSGDYERFFEADGVRYCHIFDPKTGYPAKNGIISITVITSDATLADVYSTALFVMGPKKALDYANRKKTLEVIIVTDKEEILYSDGLKDGLGKK